jgi:hypothetical protein
MGIQVALGWAESHGPWSIWDDCISVAKKIEAECVTVHKNNRAQVKTA